MRSGFLAMRNRKHFETISELVRQFSGEFLDNFLKKTIIQNELANAKRVCLERRNQTDFSSEESEMKYHLN